MKARRFAILVLLFLAKGAFAQYQLVPRTNDNPAFVYTASPDDWRDVNVYQLFTDRFYDGDSSNNNARTMRSGSWWGSNSAYGGGDTTGRSWYNSSNSQQSNDRHLAQGGDWEGLRQKIPYLQSMGVKAVWISSVQKVEQGVDKRFTPYHAYHPTDLYTCEPLFGDFAKLKQTIDELHAAGIYVILDVVPNHMADLIRHTSGNESYNAGATTSDIAWVDGIQHAPPFDRLDWFNPQGNIGNYDAYPETQLGGFKGTDDLNNNRADVRTELSNAFKNLISATDCDGFRVDAIKHVDHPWIKSWATEMRQHAASLGKDDFLIFGELFSFDDGFHNFFTGDQGSGFNSAMWFTMMNSMRDVFAGSGATSNLTGHLDGIWNGNTFGAEANARSIAFIDNHDVDRVSKDYTTSWPDMLRPAMGLLYCATPVPTIYYGTEHGFNQGQANNNPGADDGDYQRECMMDYGYQWGNAQGDKFAAASPIKDLIGQLNAARAAYPCLTRGSFTQRWQAGGRGIYAFSRTLGEQEALVVLNTDWNNAQSCTPAVGKTDGTVFTNFLNPTETATVSGGTLSLSIPTRGLKVFVAGVAVEQPLAISNTRNWPTNGNITATDTIYLDADTSPKGEAVSGEARYSLDGGTTWTSLPLARNPSFDTATTDAWNASFGPLAAGTSALYEVSFTDTGSNTVIDNNGGAYRSLSVNAFTMDGLRDSDDYLVVDADMDIWAAVRGSTLYFATWSSEGGPSDHFLLCQKDFGNPEDHPWRDAGVSKANFYFAGWPWLAAEGDNNYFVLNNGGASGQSAEGPGGQVLEGKINLVEVFGEVPEIIYLSALAYGTNSSDGIAAQGPYAWDVNSNLEITEMAAIRIDSIRDEDGDGFHDGGRPSFTSTVENADADANYGIRRFFIDELAGESASISFAFNPGTNPAETVSGVELITNLNRRDHAVIQEDLDTVTTSSDTYYRAYPMTGNAGEWTITLPVTTCGAYRGTVRYQVDGVTYYYTDRSNLRRDLAIIVSPRKALDLSIYEVNPLIVEATDDTFAGRSTFRDLWMDNTDRPDAVSAAKFNQLGVNMLWLQPIHPIGTEARENDPATGQPYDPGSPYAVKDYWQINPALGANNSESGAMTEFQAAVAALDSAGVGVMMDGTFNHSAPDAILGQGAVELFGDTAASLIRDDRPEWYSKTGNYSLPAANATEQAVAPDRRDFGKWNDVRDFYFGSYDALVKYDSDSHTQEHLLERDALEQLTPGTIELWEYFAHYPIYWLEKSGHPTGTAAADSYKGIDGLRCDFAQGLPSEFWEFCINKTRSVKWDFLFMAESLDGTRSVNGSNKHGVSYRSARHFDILNENSVFYWRDTFFDYPANGPGTGGTGTRETANTFNNFALRNEAYEGIVLLQNQTSHDEVFPSDDPYEMLHVHAQLSALKGAPMMMYGQEAGAQNDFATYAFNGGIADASRNFSRYEQNFGKTIPNFKRWNAMSGVWTNADTNLRGHYERINQTRLASPALRDPADYYLNLDTGGFAVDVFAIAKVDSTSTAPDRDVVLAFVNNSPKSGNTGGTFALDGGAASFIGIDPAANYNVANLLSPTPSLHLWPADRTGQDLIDNGLTVFLDGNVTALGQAQYLQLINTSATTNDADEDNLPDDWEALYGLSSSSATGDDGADGDPDGDGLTNFEEYLVGLDPTVDDDHLFQLAIAPQPGDSYTLRFPTIPDRIYQIEYSNDDFTGWTAMGPPLDTTGLAANPATQIVDDGTHSTPAPSTQLKRFYRIVVTLP